MVQGEHAREGLSAEVRKARIKPDQLVFFHRQLASMLKLDLPIAKGLKELAREAGDAVFREVIESVRLGSAEIDGIHTSKRT